MPSVVQQVCGLSGHGSGGPQALSRAASRFTNLTRTFKGTLDYILYTSNSLAPTAVLELPEELEVGPRSPESLTDVASSEFGGFSAVVLHTRESLIYTANAND